ncbi:MAG TPA: hypothetical protein PKD49_07295 [Hyphomicrobium sp.]|nr:hypothetical protein [Hyphomicrobium sp.]
MAQAQTWTGPKSAAAYSGDELKQTVEEATTQVSQMAQSAGRQVRTVAEDVKDVIARNPYTTLAVAASLAFTIGALWKLGSRPASRFDRILRDLQNVDLPSRADILSGRWR